MKSMTCARGQCWAVPHMARTAQTPLYTTAPVGYGADPPYMPTAQRPPAVPPVLTGGIEGVGSIS